MNLSSPADGAAEGRAGRAIGRKIVIGDVHGQYDGLMYLLALVAPGLEDEICFVGDLIDRGPKSAQVVDFVKNSPYHCLMGNHEKMLVDAVQGGQILQPALHAWLYSGGQSTLMSYQDVYGEMGIPEDHFIWLSQLPLYLDWGDYWVVHAGVDPKRSIDSQTAREFCWIRDEFQNAPQPYFETKTIVTGHTITFTLPGIEPGQVARGPGWIDIDTGAYHPRSGWLTALDVTNDLVYQVNIYHAESRQLPLDQIARVIDPVVIAAASPVAVPLMEVSTTVATAGG